MSLAPVRVHNGRFWRFALLVGTTGNYANVIERRHGHQVRVRTVSVDDVEACEFPPSVALTQHITTNADRWGATKAAALALGRTTTITQEENRT